MAAEPPDEAGDPSHGEASAVAWLS